MPLLATSRKHSRFILFLPAKMRGSSALPAQYFPLMVVFSIDFNARLHVVISIIRELSCKKCGLGNSY